MDVWRTRFPYCIYATTILIHYVHLLALVFACKIYVGATCQTNLNFIKCEVHATSHHSSTETMLLMAHNFHAFFFSFHQQVHTMRARTARVVGV